MLARIKISVAVAVSAATGGGGDDASPCHIPDWSPRRARGGCNCLSHSAMPERIGTRETMGQARDNGSPTTRARNASYWATGYAEFSPGVASESLT